MFLLKTHFLDEIFAILIMPSLSSYPEINTKIIKQKFCIIIYLSSSFLIHAFDHKTHAHMIISSLFDLSKVQTSNMHKIKGNWMWT